MKDKHLTKIKKLLSTDVSNYTDKQFYRLAYKISDAVTASSEQSEIDHVIERVTKFAKKYPDLKYDCTRANDYEGGFMYTLYVDVDLAEDENWDMVMQLNKVDYAFISIDDKSHSFNLDFEDIILTNK